MNLPSRYRNHPAVILLILLSVFIPVDFAQLAAQSPETQLPQKTGVVDNIIGSTFKTLAKTFTATVDIDKLKKYNIERLKKSDENKFRRQYLKVYNTVKDCPWIIGRYGLTQDLSKAEAIDKINSLDKKKIYQTINAVPNSFIADQFKSYLAKKEEEIKKSDIKGQVGRLWGQIVGGAYGKKKQGKAK